MPALDLRTAFDAIRVTFWASVKDLCSGSYGRWMRLWRPVRQESEESKPTLMLPEWEKDGKRTASR